MEKIMSDFSMTITTPEKSPTVREIGICGAMTIHHADEIRTGLLEALNEADEVLLEMGEVSEIDLVGLQLFCSAHKTSIVMMKQFRFEGRCTGPVNEAIHTSGFNRHVGCAQDIDQTCIWLGGGK
jgi:anti-anti-sigma regulatory factor